MAGKGKEKETDGNNNDHNDDSHRRNNNNIHSSTKDNAGIDCHSGTDAGDNADTTGGKKKRRRISDETLREDTLVSSPSPALSSTDLPSCSSALPLTSFPVEIQLHIISYLTINDITLLSLSSKYFHSLLKDNAIWRGLSLKRWGPLVLETTFPDGEDEEGNTDKNDDTDNQYCIRWRNYYRHRSSTPRSHLPSPLPTSPIALIQEFYQDDPWRLLVCCIMCARTTTSSKYAILATFFERWPTPSSVCAVDYMGRNETYDAMFALISPLGMQHHRIQAAARFSRQFVTDASWQMASELYGIGRFGEDSWRLFCGGADAAHDGWMSIRIDDCNVRSYQKWLLTLTQHSGMGRPEVVVEDASESTSANRGATPKKKKRRALELKRKRESPRRTGVEGSRNGGGGELGRGGEGSTQPNPLRRKTRSNVRSGGGEELTQDGRGERSLVEGRTRGRASARVTSARVTNAPVKAVRTGSGKKRTVAAPGGGGRRLRSTSSET
eukprot:TRINITY_DN14815_c0_g1_i1.p1 TRINITY_DN14815_c0_g1~~TRINITY_DN14815_c0_g1_i1.p1  ORF type:complete len:496 (-),score=83.73 TRINITY_DN14815_c0_g1_i1:121-1608(-)